jgi:outer membrane receptor for ferrienterochelin and colicin
MKTVILLIFMLSACLMYGQKYTISGYVEDASTGERLTSATVYEEITKQGVIANAYGFFSITLSQPGVRLIVSFVGYQPEIREMNLTQNLSLIIKLRPTISLQEVEVKGQRTQIENPQISVTEIPVQTVKSLPVLLGETDLIKVIQLLPGVQSGSEGSSGLYVRGGGPDQNLILLDGVPVYNADHLFGFFSVFNSDAIQNVTLIKGGFPARYGGRLSSVLDIRMKEGNNKEYHGEGSIGIISSKVVVEGPIIKDTSSFIVSARRTYIDILTMPIIMSLSDGAKAGYYFWDLNAKVNYTLSEKDRLFVSFYGGRDKAYGSYKQQEWSGTSSSSKFGLSWGNIITALRWNHEISPRLFTNVTGTYSNYDFSIQEKMKYSSSDGDDEYMLRYNSGIRDWAVKADFNYHPSPRHSVMFGGGYTYHTFYPGVTLFRYSSTSSQNDNIDTTFGNSFLYAHDLSAFAEDEYKIGSRLVVNPGLHYSLFRVQGMSYHSLQPRISARYILHDKWAVKAAYTQMTQSIHLLVNSGIGMPTDLWLPSTKKIEPQHSQQWAAGVFHDLPGGYEASVEGYYKTMDNVIEYKPGASFFGQAESWENKVEAGMGTAYGAEFLLRKNKGKTTGWIGYTLSWANRQFEDINFGEPYPYRYDRRHDIGVAVTHKFNEKMDAGLVWVYGTGNAVSLPIEQYPAMHDPFSPSMFDTYALPYYEGKNQFRTPAYHRLDIGFNFHKELKRAVRTWSVGVYNLYNRKNPFVLYFETDYNSNKRHLKQLSLFPMIPSISYNLKF